jgi:ketosteroid isomerase-like protein
MSNQDTVRDIYAAFGRGDIPAILDRLAPGVRWDHWPDGSGGQRHGVPWLEQRTGPEEVGGFFETLAALEFHRFEPTALIGEGDRIAALIDVEVTVRATGERFRDGEVHLWTFDDGGRVCEFRHVVDTAKHVDALRAGAPA